MARRARKETLLNLIDRFTPELQKAFLDAVQGIKDEIQIGAIVDAITRGDTDAAVRAMGIDQAAMRPVTAAIERAYETGGIFTAAQFERPMGAASFRFDVRNSRAEAWLRDYSSDQVTRITNDQLGQIRDILNRGMQRGINPRDMALDLIGRIDPLTGRRVGGVIGLNGPQQQYLANARRELMDLDPSYFNRTLRDRRFDPTIQKAIQSGTPLTPDQINKITGRYSDNLLQWRGETIARDQALTALNRSADEAVRQLVEVGNVDERDVERIWDATGDNRVRETHREMDGQKVGLNEPFITPNGDRLMYPGDSSLGAPPEETIQCRCRLSIRINYIAAAKRRAKAEGINLKE